MDITEFFQLSAGKWFSQRTTHYLASGQLLSGKSELKIEILPPSNPLVTKLCEQHDFNPAACQCFGVQVAWEGTPGPNQSKQTHGTVLVPIVNAANPKEGTMLLESSGAAKTAMTSRCLLSNDDVLTLITESESFYAEERLWYLMPNLRLRSSLVQQDGNFTYASFYSEIRMGLAKA